MFEEAKTNLEGTGNFIHAFIQEDLKGETNKLLTRFPPEPNGYLHIGHAKSICLNFGLARLYGGKCNMRFDDTNPEKEEQEYIDSILDDVRWLGGDFGDRLFYASGYFDQLYEFAIKLIKEGKAFVCDLTAEEVRQYRGTLNEPGKESPYKNRSIEENLDLFIRMKDGEFGDGEKTLRAKIDMSSPNINMRDPVIYRILHATHHNTGDKWCIYPMYDYQHPLSDAIEGITHSICTLEFEDHRPLYNWCVEAVGLFEHKPRQVEFAKLDMTHTMLSKRNLRRLVEENIVDGWDDPRMATIKGIRRRGYTAESIKMFCDKIGVSKAGSKVDIGLLEFCIREDLKSKAPAIMAVLDPIKVVLTNYPENSVEYLELRNNPENEEMGTRKIPFSRELYIERDDFMENPTSKYHRLAPDKEVRLYGAYYIKCNEVIKDSNGNIVELHCTYDPETKSGSGFSGRKVKGTIHWVSINEAVKTTARLYDYLFNDNEDGTISDEVNPNSLVVCDSCFVEPYIKEFTNGDRFQFMRNGYYIIDVKDSKPDHIIFNRIVQQKSSYKPE